VKGVFAFGSVGTLAFTLASQGVIRQFISGLLLIFSNKMYVGDNVTFGDGTAGRVTKLGFMETILRNSDNTVTRVPNALLAEQKISNVSRVRQSQVKQTLRFHYEDADKLPQVIDDIKEEIKKTCTRMITDGTRPFRGTCGALRLLLLCRSFGKSRIARSAHIHSFFSFLGQLQ
jgi:small-conductance mechanosensitive channel